MALSCHSPPLSPFPLPLLPPPAEQPVQQQNLLFVVCVHSAYSERTTLQTRLSSGLINCNWCNFVASIFALSFSWISFCFGHVCSCSFSFAAAPASPLPGIALHVLPSISSLTAVTLKLLIAWEKWEQGRDKIRAEVNRPLHINTAI